MTLYPEVQKKAQAEIDAVVGNDRLPTVSQDWDRLPYLRAVCSEVLRWMPVGPMGGSNIESLTCCDYLTATPQPFLIA
jgi:cytochrome P450